MCIQYIFNQVYLVWNLSYTLVSCLTMSKSHVLLFPHLWRWYNNLYLANCYQHRNCI